MYDELVKRLRESTDNHDEKCESCPYEEDYPCCVDCLDKMHKDAADAIEELSRLNAEITQRELKLRMSKPRWISVTERLPESEEYVWAVYKNSLFPNGKSHHKTLKYNGKMWIDENGYRYSPANITHWKQRDPLPQPPKEW